MIYNFPFIYWHPEKCRIAKQKRGQDSKRIDKKSFKAGVKAKFDPFTSKASFINSDSTLGGIDGIGMLLQLLIYLLFHKFMRFF